MERLTEEELTRLEDELAKGRGLVILHAGTLRRLLADLRNLRRAGDALATVLASPGCDALAAERDAHERGR